jgi:hypothetical protein
MPASYNVSGRVLQPSASIVFFPQVRYCYTLASQELRLHILRMRRHRLDAVFLTQVYSGSKFCPAVLETVGLRVLVLISIRRLSESQGLVWPEGLGKLKNSFTSSGLEPATFRLVA